MAGSRVRGEVVEGLGNWVGAEAGNQVLRQVRYSLDGSVTSRSESVVAAQTIPRMLEYGGSSSVKDNSAIRRADSANQVTRIRVLRRPALSRPRAARPP